VESQINSKAPSIGHQNPGAAPDKARATAPANSTVMSGPTTHPIERQ
jgi:hypothetical protein